MYFRRIRDLRDDNNKTQQDIADLLHCQVTVYRRYESGEREIPISMLIKLAKYYNVSIDYIVEMNDN